MPTSLPTAVDALGSFPGEQWELLAPRAAFSTYIVVKVNINYLCLVAGLES